VPYYWIIDPEDRVLIAYALDDGRYRTVFAASGREETAAQCKAAQAPRPVDPVPRAE